MRSRSPAHCRRLSCLTVAGVLLAAAAFSAAPQPARAAVGAEAAGKQIAERYDVQVLKVAPGEIDGRKVWLLTVMVPGGNSNSAFQVHRLAVDQESGDLVPSFRHHTEGYTLPPAAPGGERP
ncbi:hypothetical protein [Pelagibius sp. 7325]|uniref:hypothetical protein n=1 Tax=Pelagibius sp. 7325 TaxID=3131994 RepID=UPI0030EE59CB